MPSGGDSAPKSTPVEKYTPEQEALLKDIIGFIQPQIGQTATAFGGKTFAEQPQLAEDAFKGYLANTGGYEQEIAGAMQSLLGGEAAFKYDPQDTADVWRTGFANPLMQVFQEETVPMIKEQFGEGLFSTQVGKTVGRESTNLMNSVIAPALFGAQMTERMAGIQSKEAAVGRQAQAIPMAQNLAVIQFQQDMSVAQAVQAENQRKLNDAYQQFLRMTTEASPWLQLGMQAAGLGSQGRLDTLVEPGSTGMNPLLMAGAGAVGGAMAGAEIGAIGGPWGAILGAGVGFGASQL